MRLNDKYGFERQKPLIEFLSLEKDKPWKSKENLCRIALITKGKIECYDAKNGNISITAPKMFLLPPNDVISAKIKEESSMITICINDKDHLEPLTIIQQDGLTKQKQPGIYSLKINEILMEYARSLKLYRDKGISNDFLYNLKIKELVYIMKASYCPQQLYAFFQSYITADLHFSEKVYKLSNNINNVRQMASQMYYSYSGFNKRFRRTFGISAYSWLKQKRAQSIYYQLCHTDKALKQISEENNFHTLSHFNEFCHRNLGDSPRKIREKQQLSI